MGYAARSPVRCGTPITLGVLANNGRENPEWISGDSVDEIVRVTVSHPRQVHFSKDTRLG